MSLLFVDCETYSEADINVGSYAYADHPSTEVIIWSVRSPDWQRSLVFETASLWLVLAELKGASMIKWTRNEPLDLIHWNDFDRLIVRAQSEGEWPKEHPDLPLLPGPNNTYWCDLRDVSLSYGGPGALEHAAKWWGKSQLKDSGKELISRFCKPDKHGKRVLPTDDPARWAKFLSYAAQDTEVMWPIYHRLMSIEGGHTPYSNWRELRAVGRMNERGVPIDRDSVATSLTIAEHAEAQLVVECQEEYGFKPSQREVVRQFLGTPDLKKETIEDWVFDDPDQKRVAEIRQQVGGAARKKLVPMLRMGSYDGRVRGCFNFHGAWTRRLTSFGVQFQNMIRSASSEAFFETLSQDYSDEIFEDIRSNVRGYIQAPEGKVLVAGDYSQIELRIGAWLTGETWLLDLFRSGGDPYKKMASDLYGCSVAEVTDRQRQFGKVVELGCQFQARFALVEQAKGFGLDISHAEIDIAVNVYRARHLKIVGAWDTCAAAFYTMMVGPVGATMDVIGCRFERQKEFIRIVRPSGHAQYYWLPHEVVTHWDNCQGACPGCKTETRYMGRFKSGAMIKQSTYGGNIFQGIVQCTAAGLMLHGMVEAERAGFSPVLSVHDEIVCEEHMPDIHEGRLVEELCEVMCQLPAWAKGLPVTADGWQQRRYTK